MRRVYIGKSYESAVYLRKDWGYEYVHILKISSEE